MTDRVRVSMLGVQALREAAPAGRVSMLASSALVQYVPRGRLNMIGVQVLRTVAEPPAISWRPRGSMAG